MSEAVVLTEVDHRGVATITLNRPDKFNTWNPELLNTLLSATESLGNDKNVRVVLVRGNGKHFSAGADVNWFKELAESGADIQRQGSALSLAAIKGLYELPKPTIALIHGACFGGGTGYAAACDVVVASEDAKFAITEVRVGITPAPILPELVAALGVRQVRRYAVSGETFDASQAGRIGLVHELCAEGELDLASAPIVDAFLRSGPDASSSTKRLIAEIAGTEFTDALAARMTDVSAAGRGAAEGVEGFKAFLEKRTPNWYPGEDKA